MIGCKTKTCSYEVGCFLCKLLHCQRRNHCTSIWWWEVGQRGLPCPLVSISRSQGMTKSSTIRLK